MDNDKPKALILFMHGFGDNVMATPAVREISKTHKVDILVYNKTLASNLWLNCDFIDNVYDIELARHPRYWNPLAFWCWDRWRVLSKVKSLFNLRDYEKVLFPSIYLFPHFVYVIFPKLLARYHKIDQIGYSLGVKKLATQKTEVYLSHANRKAAVDFVLLNQLSEFDVIIGLHMTTVEKKRDLSPDFCRQIISRLEDELGAVAIVLFGSLDTKKQQEDRYGEHLAGESIFPTFDDRSGLSIMESIALLEVCDLVIAIDSSILHSAMALNVPCLGVFRSYRIKPDQRMLSNEKCMSCFMAEVTTESLVEKSLKLLNREQNN